MNYNASDFLETAGEDTLKLIARTRELTREYASTAYGDTEKKTAILRELLGGIGENVAIETPFHCNLGKNIFLGSDVIINRLHPAASAPTIEQQHLFCSVALLPSGRCGIMCERLSGGEDTGIYAIEQNKIFVQLRGGE